MSPLTKVGKKILAQMEKQYKSKEKGEDVFYASINMGKEGTEEWHTPGVLPRRRPLVRITPGRPRLPR